jgi:hypothetical protein
MCACELWPTPGAVDGGCLVQFARDVAEASQKDDRVEPKKGPDPVEHDHGQRQAGAWPAIPAEADQAASG